MAKLISNAIEIKNMMKDQGKVVSLSFDESSSIDYNLGKDLKRFKDEFILKERNSRHLVAQFELGSINK